MITTLLQGGLGNQMFQISAAYALALENNTEAVFDINNHHLPLQGRKVENYKNNIFRNVKFSPIERVSKIYNEPGFNFRKIEYLDGLALRGYFQSEKYFKKFETEIRDLFSEHEELTSYLDSKYGEILQSNELTSIHIRRGDYLKFSDVHPLCEKEYYLSCMNDLTNSVEVEKYLVFSDDPRWCKDNFKTDKFHIVSGEEDYVDLFLMARCKNNIIANSSFSWWSAWLNKHDKKVVYAPKNWFGKNGPKNYNDLIPEGWIKK